jgi:hypothetical protein
MMMMMMILLLSFITAIKNVSIGLNNKNAEELKMIDEIFSKLSIYFLMA